MNEAGVLSSARLCCPCFIGTTTPSDSLPATFHFIFRLIGLFFTACAVQGRVSLVPSTTVSTCRSLYTGEFFRAAFPSSWRVPWPSPKTSGLGTLLSHFRVAVDGAAGFTASCYGLQIRITGLRPKDLSSKPPVSCGAAWPLLRPNFHRQVVPSLARRASLRLPLLICN